MYLNEKQKCEIQTIQQLSWIFVRNHQLPKDFANCSALFLVINPNKNLWIVHQNFNSEFFFCFRFEITNEIPSHPAGSFHYPEKSSLPFIATFTFVKEKEYELSEVFNFNFKRNNPKNNNIDNASSKTKVNKYLYEVDDNEDIDNSIVKFVPTGDEKILKVLNVEKPTPTPTPSIKTTPKPVVEIKSKR